MAAASGSPERSNNDLIGRTGKPFMLDVERGKIYEFARATRNEDPACWEERPVSPPTFLTTQFHWATDAASDVAQLLHLDWARCLHASQEFEFTGPPPRAGTRLRGVSHIADVYAKDGRASTLTFAVIATEFRDQSDHLVATSRLTLVEVRDREVVA